ALERGLAPEVMANLKVRPDRLDDTAAQLEGENLVGASPRGWEDVSRVLRSPLSEEARQVLVRGRIGAANAAEFFGVLRELQAGADVLALLAAEPGAATAALLPRTLEGLYGLVYGLLGAATSDAAMARALAILGQLEDIRAGQPRPQREVRTLAVELLAQRALASGLERARRQAGLDHAAAEEQGDRHDPEADHLHHRAGAARAGQRNEAHRD
ncbi:MAG: hypothetical protein ACK56I_20650, partial [bacterium]